MAAGVFLGTWLSGGETDPEPVVQQHVGGRGVIATEENIEELRAQRRDDDGRFRHYRTRMSNDWVFQTATSPSTNVFVENAPSNPGTVFFDVVLPDTGEVIFSSPYLPLGARIDSITLDVELPPGEYSPVVIYHLLDDDYEVRTTVSVGINLRILE